MGIYIKVKLVEGTLLLMRRNRLGDVVPRLLKRKLRYLTFSLGLWTGTESTVLFGAFGPGLNWRFTCSINFQHLGF